MTTFNVASLFISFLAILLPHYCNLPDRTFRIFKIAQSMKQLFVQCVELYTLNGFGTRQMEQNESEFDNKYFNGALHRSNQKCRVISIRTNQNSLPLTQYFYRFQSYVQAPVSYTHLDVYKRQELNNR